MSFTLLHVLSTPRGPPARNSCSRSELFVLYRYSLQQPVQPLYFFGLRTEQFVPDLQYALRRQLRTVRDISEL